jgi:hypothetical protein
MNDQVARVIAYVLDGNTLRSDEFKLLIEYINKYHDLLVIKYILKSHIKHYNLLLKQKEILESLQVILKLVKEDA